MTLARFGDAMVLATPCASIAGNMEPARSYGAEFDVLLACARTSMDAATAARLRHLLRQEIDWGLLADLAGYHQVAPLLALHLCRSHADACPAEVLDELHQVLRANTARNLVLARALVDVVARFDSRSIPVIAFKGPLLAEAVYGHAGLRTFVDLDIFVESFDYHSRVPDLLLADGWRMIADHDYERTFEGARRGLQLDVHRSFTPSGQMPLMLGFRDAWRRSQHVVVAGSRVRSLALPDLLIVLCVQLARDVVDRGTGPLLIKVCDIAELARRFPGSAWEDVVGRAKRLGALRMLHIGLRTAEDLVGASLPSQVRDASRHPRLDSLVRHAKERIAGGPAARPSRTELMDPRRWHAEVRERARDRCAARCDVVRRVFAPNGRDYAVMRLPRALRWAYFLIRPLRVAAKYSRIALGRMAARLAH